MLVHRDEWCQGKKTLFNPSESAREVTGLDWIKIPKFVTCVSGVTFIQTGPFVLFHLRSRILGDFSRTSLEEGTQMRNVRLSVCLSVRPSVRPERFVKTAGPIYTIQTPFGPKFSLVVPS